MSVKNDDFPTPMNMVDDVNAGGDAISSSFSDLPPVKLEKEDDLTLDQISDKELENWNHFLASFKSSKNVEETCVKDEFSKKKIYKIPKDPFGLYTLIFWYKDDSIRDCPDPDRRMQLTKKGVENDFTLIGKCFATCYEEEIDKDMKTVGCISFEKESNALTALNDPTLVAKYNLELCPEIYPHGISEKIKGTNKQNHTDTLDGTSINLQSHNSPLHKDATNNIAYHCTPFENWPNAYPRSFNELSSFTREVSGYPASASKPAEEDWPIQPRLGDNQYATEIPQKVDAAEKYVIEKQCTSFIQNLRWGTNKDVPYNAQEKTFKRPNDSSTDLRESLTKKRKNAYKDLDAVEEEDYSCSWTREGSLEFLNTRASKQFEWDKLLAEVKSQLGAEVIVPEASINIKVENMNPSPEEVYSDIDIFKNQKENEIQYHHMMVKHRLSNRPSSWREKNITRSKEEAVKCIEEYKAQIEKGLNKFEEIADKFSDCSSTKSSEYRQFGSEKIVQLFEDTVRMLKVGQISGPIITHEGIHILERIV